MLILSRKINESIIIGDQIEISIVDIKGDQAKLGIKAPKNVRVYRFEVTRRFSRKTRRRQWQIRLRYPTLTCRRT